MRIYKKEERRSECKVQWYLKPGITISRLEIPQHGEDRDSVQKRSTTRAARLPS